jgi:glycosyltransferase involved in cell wall biosynthesis
MSARLRVAWWSPLPPDPSGIADYADELLPHLARFWDIALFADGEVAPALADLHPVVDARDEEAAIARLPGYDAVLYHLGNNPAHLGAYRALQRHHGLVVLHDASLAHLVIHATHLAGRTDRLFAELRALHGDLAAEAVRRHFYLHEPAPWDVEPLRFPLLGRALGAARAVLVHSRFAAEQVRRAMPGLPVEVVEHHALPPPTHVSFASTAPGAPVVFCTAGFLTPAKHIDLVLAALAKLRGRVAFRYRLVGTVAPGFPLYGQVRDHGLLDHVDLVGHVSKERLYAELAEADVCVNLRHPTSGETSGIVQRALAAGRPVVVSDVGWFSELPDACAVKVPAGEGEVRALAVRLEELARDPARRAAMSEAALAYAARLDPASRAAAYDAFVRREARSLAGSPERALDHALREAAAAIGLASGDDVPDPEAAARDLLGVGALCEPAVAPAGSSARSRPC